MNLEYNAETGLFRWLVRRGGPQKLGWFAGCPDGKGYTVINYNGKLYRGHRLAWYLYYKQWPTMDLDHINGNKADNRICNLREVTVSENMKNHYRLKNEKRMATLDGKNKTVSY